MDEQGQLLTTSNLVQSSEFPKPTLRFWEKELEGISVPVRTRGGQRRYSVETISVIEGIQRISERGMSLPEIKRDLSNSDRGGNSNSNRIDLLAARVAEVVRAEVNRFIEGNKDMVE